MANPNIVGVSAIYGNTVYLIPNSTSANTWSALTPSTGTVNKIDSIVATNVTANSATVTVSINSATGGGGTAYRICYQISVPANAALIVVDKTTSFYVQDNQSVVVTSGTGSAIEYTATYEAIT
jgi:hypothetical protein